MVKKIIHKITVSIILPLIEIILNQKSQDIKLARQIKALFETAEYIDDYMEEYDLGGYKIKYLSNQPNDLEGGFFYVVIKFRIIVNDVEVILIIDYYDCSDTDCTFSYDTNTNITEDLIYKEIYNIHQRWLPVKEAYGTWNRIKNSA